MKANKFLGECGQVLRDRTNEYGPVVESIARIATQQTQLLDRQVFPYEVCLQMIALKTARLSRDPGNLDTQIDLVNYVALLHETLASEGM